MMSKPPRVQLRVTLHNSFSHNSSACKESNTTDLTDKKLFCRIYGRRDILHQSHLLYYHSRMHFSSCMEGIGKVLLVMISISNLRFSYKVSQYLSAQRYLSLISPQICYSEHHPLLGLNLTNFI